MPHTLTQIAFGITDIDSNPDFFAMMKYARDHGVVPNYTTSGGGVTPEIAAMTAQICGAVSVSVYDKDTAYNAVKMFTDAGVGQVNLHFLLAEETYEAAFDVLRDRLKDPRLASLRAVVFLAYKPKGKKPQVYHTIKDVKKYQKLIQFCTLTKTGFGCDSCSAPMVLKAYEGSKIYDQVSPMIEPCESSLFSAYINAEGKFFPCSFTEGERGWETGIDVLGCKDFVDDVWNHPRVKAFRETLLGTTKGCEGCRSQRLCRSCPLFDMRGCS